MRPRERSTLSKLLAKANHRKGSGNPCPGLGEGNGADYVFVGTMVPFRRFLLVFTLTILAGGCTTLPIRNAPLGSYSEDVGYRFGNIAPSAANSDRA